MLDKSLHWCQQTMLPTANSIKDVPPQIIPNVSRCKNKVNPGRPSSILPVVSPLSSPKKTTSVSHLSYKIRKKKLKIFPFVVHFLQANALLKIISIINTPLSRAYPGNLTCPCAPYGQEFGVSGCYEREGGVGRGNCRKLPPNDDFFASVEESFL